MTHNDTKHVKRAPIDILADVKMYPKEVAHLYLPQQCETPTLRYRTKKNEFLTPCITNAYNEFRIICHHIRYFVVAKQLSTSVTATTPQLPTPPLVTGDLLLTATPAATKQPHTKGKGPGLQVCLGKIQCMILLC